MTEPEEDIITLSSQDPFLRVGDFAQVQGASLSYEKALIRSIDEFAGTVTVAGLIDDGEQTQASYYSKTDIVARANVHRILKVGDYVKVKFGFGEGRHGSIISLDDSFVTLLTASKGVHAETFDSVSSLPSLQLIYINDMHYQITVRSAWVSTCEDRVEQATGSRAWPEFPPLTGNDPWKGARVWIRIDRHYKGSVGNIVSTNPLTRTALVQRDGAIDNVPVKIDLWNLIDL